MNKLDKVYVVGTGAVGSVLAGLLHKAGHIEPVLVGQSPHWLMVKKNGLYFKKADEGEKLLSIIALNPHEMPVLNDNDVVLLTGKITDAENVAKWLEPKLSLKTPCVALQNGIGIRQTWEKYLKKPVERGLAYFGANSARPGQVRYFPGALRFEKSQVTEKLLPLFEGVELRCRVKDDFGLFVWLKLAINCIANPLAGLLGLNNANISDRTLNPTKKAILSEVLAVAKAHGHDLGLTVEKINNYLGGENTPSLRADLLRGRKTEIDFLNGAVARLGKEKGIYCPANELIANLVEYLSQNPQEK